MNIDTIRVAPSARKRISIDFDLTLFDWGAVDELPLPLPNAMWALRTLIDRGYEPFILTSRFSPTWWVEHCTGTDKDPVQFGNEQQALVRLAMKNHGFPDIHITCEKLPALAYIDDRAITYTRDWHAILKLLP